MYRERWYNRDEPPEIIATEPFWCAICNEIYDEEEEPNLEVNGERVCPFCYEENQVDGEIVDDEE